MKIGSILMGIALLAASCKTQPVNQQQKLLTLKEEEQKIKDQIAGLEGQMHQQGDPSKLINVAVMKIEPSDFKNYIEVQGKVEANENVNVVPEVPAVVTRVDVQVGQQVVKGQLLAQLDDQVVRQSLSQLKTQLTYLQNLYQRQKNLWDENIGTKVQLLTAKNNVENIQKQIDVSRSQLDMYRVKSPINGVVDAFDVYLGQMISPTAIRVVNTDELKVTGQVGENYSSQVKKGDQVTLIFPDNMDTLNTQLSYVSQVIDPISRSFNIEIRLHQKEKGFKPNMVTVIKIVGYENKHALVIPINPILNTQTGDYVFLADGGKARKEKITLGQVYNGRAEVLSGLKAGDQLIVTGFQDMDNGVGISY
ncbi:MAG: efflux RND transporter periplasmic adaptor subunit [Chitinophagaceae bacterium]